MAERIRFHLDEHMDPDIATALRGHGIDVTTTRDAALQEAPDEHHLEFIRQEHRVVVTDDTDFLRIARTTSDHPGIVYCRRTGHSMGEIIRFLILVHEVYGSDEMVGHVEYV